MTLMFGDRKQDGNRKSPTADLKQSSTQSTDSCENRNNGGLIGVAVKQKSGQSCRHKNRMSKRDRVRSALGFFKSTVASRNKLISRSHSTHSGDESASEPHKFPNEKYAMGGSKHMIGEENQAIGRKRHIQYPYSRRVLRELHKALQVQTLKSNSFSPELSRIRVKDIESHSSFSSDRDHPKSHWKRGGSPDKLRKAKFADTPLGDIKMKNKERKIDSYSNSPSHQIRRTFDRVNRNPVDSKPVTKALQQEHMRPFKEHNRLASSSKLTPHTKHQSLDGDYKTHHTSGSEYSTITTAISKDSVSPGQACSASVIQAGSGRCCYSSQSYSDGPDLQDFKARKHCVGRCPDRLSAVRQTGVHINEDDDIIISALGECFSKCSRSGCSSQAFKEKLLLNNDGRYHGAGCRFKRSQAGVKHNMNHQKHQHNSRNKVPLRDPAYREIPRQAMEKSFTGTGPNKSRCVRSHEDLTSQLQSVMEYQALLAENIRYLSCQLDQLVSQLPHGSLATSTTETSQRKYRGACRDQAPSQESVNLQVESKERSINNLDENYCASSTLLLSHAHKSQQTEGDIPSTKSSPNVDVPKAESLSGDFRNSPSAFDRSAKKASRDSSPAETKDLDTSIMAASCQHSSPNQSIPHPCDGFQHQSSPWDGDKRNVIPPNSGRHSSGMCALLKTKSHEQQVSSTQVSKLLQEMEMWKEKLAMSVPDRGLTSNISSGPLANLERGQGKAPGSTRMSRSKSTAGDKNWSSSVKTCRSRSSDVNIPGDPGSGTSRSCVRSPGDPGSGTSRSCVRSPGDPCSGTSRSCVRTPGDPGSGTSRSCVRSPGDPGSGTSRSCVRTPDQERVRDGDGLGKSLTLDKTSSLKVTVGQLVLLLITVLFQFIVQMAVTSYRA